jgi:tRNA(Ile2) C34 agmatinyltransferase TiaS
MSVAEQQVVIAAAKAAHDAKNAGKAPHKHSHGSELATAAVVLLLTVAILALAIWRNG